MGISYTTHVKTVRNVYKLDVNVGQRSNMTRNL